MYPNFKKVIFPYENRDGSISWVVEYPDLPGCSAVGDSEESALRESKIALELWLDEYHDAHGEYPVPKIVDPTYSGKLLLRLPKSLHQRLAEQADDEGVSLNTLVIALLAQNHGGFMFGSGPDPHQVVIYPIKGEKDLGLALCDLPKSDDYYTNTAQVRKGGRKRLNDSASQVNNSKANKRSK